MRDCNIAEPCKGNDPLRAAWYVRVPNMAIRKKVLTMA